MTDRINTTDKGLLDVTLEAHVHRFTVKSDFARKHAEYVAMAACRGLISTQVFGCVYSSEWRPTTKGLAFLNEKGEDHDYDQPQEWESDLPQHYRDI